MATNPTRRQTQARDELAGILNQLASTWRLDGNPRVTSQVLERLGQEIAKLSSAYTQDTIVARALEQRALAMGLASGLAEMLTLLESSMSPLQMLWLDDDGFREQVAAIEAELGEV